MNAQFLWLRQEDGDFAENFLEGGLHQPGIDISRNRKGGFMAVPEGEIQKFKTLSGEFFPHTGFHTLVRHHFVLQERNPGNPLFPGVKEVFPLFSANTGDDHG